MKEQIILPPMGESITEATIGVFLAPSGSFVKQEQEIVEVETDKVNQPLYAPANGVVEWSVKEGQTLAIGSVLGYVDTEKSSPINQEASSTEPPKNEVQKEETKPEEKQKNLEKSPSSEETKQTASQQAPISNQQNLRLGEKELISSLETPRMQNQPIKSSCCEKEESLSSESREKMSRLRSTIANRLVESLHNSAMLTTFNEIDMSAVMLLRAKYKDRFVEKYGVKLGFMSFFVKAVIEALKKFPEFNSYIDGDEVVHRNYYNVGVAVGTERGLFVPVIKGCEKMSFAGIEKAIIEYATKARSGKITIQDLEGGGFTITNGGVYGSLLSTPILNPPQVGILGMHKILNRPIAVDGQVEIRPMMYLALSYDHRLIDGKGAVSFLVYLKELLEDPSQLLFFEEES